MHVHIIYLFCIFFEITIYFHYAILYNAIMFLQVYYTHCYYIVTFSRANILLHSYCNNIAIIIKHSCNIIFVLQVL